MTIVPFVESNTPGTEVREELQVVFECCRLYLSSAPALLLPLTPAAALRLVFLTGLPFSFLLLWFRDGTLDIDALLGAATHASVSIPVAAPILETELFMHSETGWLCFLLAAFFGLLVFGLDDLG